LNNEKCAYLRVPLDKLAARTADGDRPLLTNNHAEALEELLNERDDLYRAVADVVIDADVAVADVVDQIVEFLHGSAA
jgi:shikimate kinase